MNKMYIALTIVVTACVITPDASGMRDALLNKEYREIPVAVMITPENVMNRFSELFKEFALADPEDKKETKNYLTTLEKRSRHPSCCTKNTALASGFQFSWSDIEAAYHSGTEKDMYRIFLELQNYIANSHEKMGFGIFSTSLVIIIVSAFAGVCAPLYSAVC